MGSGAEARLGDQSAFLDRGNIHPYAGGQSPNPAHLKAEFADAALVAANKPVWATEAGYHNALRTSSGHPGVSEPVAREAMRLAMHKLPMKCRFVSREGGDI